MNEKFNIGDFAEAIFMERFKDKGPIKKIYLEKFVTVTDVDRYYVELTDNFGTVHLVQKRDIEKWVKSEFVDKKAVKVEQIS